MIEADVVMGQPLIIKPTASFSSNGALNKLLSNPTAKWTVHIGHCNFTRQNSTLSDTIQTNFGRTLKFELSCEIYTCYSIVL